MAELEQYLPDVKERQATDRPRISVLPVFLMMLLTVVLSIVAIAFAVQQQQQVETARLQAVTNLKAKQIASWLNERVDDARILRGSDDFLDDYDHWRHSASAENRLRLERRLTTFSTLDRYSGVVLVSEQFSILWHTEGIEPRIDDLHRKALGEAMESGNAIHLGPYLDAADKVHFDLVMSIPATPEHQGLFVILSTHSDSFPPAELLAWPIPSASGEVILFRRDGDDILYLSELRYRPGEAVRVRQPLASENLLSSRLLLSRQDENGVVKGVDYRGEPAFAVGRRVDGTDWYLMAKMDRTELYAQVKSEALWIVLAGVLAFFMMMIAWIFHHQRRAIAIAEQRQREQSARMRSLKLFASLADSSSDAIFAKDREGRYLLFNHAAERATGKSAQDVIGQTDMAIFTPECARQIMENDAKVIAEGRVITYEESFDTPDGSFVFLAVKGPLYGDKGKVIGMYGISRDITERKTYEEAMRRSNDELSRFNLAMVGRELDMIRLKHEVNALAKELGRAAPYSIVSIDEQPSETPTTDPANGAKA